MGIEWGKHSEQMWKTAGFSPNMIYIRWFFHIYLSCTGRDLMRINKQIMEVLNHTQWQLTVVEGFKGLAFFFFLTVNQPRQEFA